MTVYDIAAALPPIPVLRDRCKALAVLDRIVGGDEPTYTYDSAWGDDEAALMSNGEGDEWTVVFTGGGAFVRVFSHESAMTPYHHPDRELWPGLLDGLPDAFRPQVEEPAFCDEEGNLLATAVLWRLAGDDRWHAGEDVLVPAPRGPYDTDPDGSGMLAILLDDVVERYITFAQDYYETDLDPTLVEHVVAHRPLTEPVVRDLRPGTTLQDVRDDVSAIGYSVDRT